MSEGIDVSKWQGNIDWSKVAAAGKTFAVARASIAGRTKDDTFAANYKGMVNNGLVPGAYHLVSGLSDGPTQAQNFKEALDAAGFDKGLLVLDVEGWSETLNGQEDSTLKATAYLCDWIYETYERTPIIYTGVYWRDNLKQYPNSMGAELWLAYYGTNNPDNYVPTAWASKGYRIWQYTSSGSVAGISGNVDLNKSAGTLRNLKSLAGWEWDELATQAEIRSIVSDEITKATATLKNDLVLDNDTVVSEIQAALRDVEDRLSQDISTNKHADVLSRDETLAKFTEVIDALSLNDTGETDDALAEIVSMVETLHKHVCSRVDLHV